ncbi:MAG TPA: hypothetical protein VF061_03370 [Gemmatimonadales bacterium]
MFRRLLSPPALVLAAAACGGDAAPHADNPLAQLTAAAQQMQKAAEGFTKRKPVPPVAFRELIEFLPDRVAGLKRAEPKGETTTVGSWQYSQAEVDFASADGSRRVDVGIFDYAHIPFLYVPFHAILGMNVAKESTDGYQRSTKIEGYPGFEEWNRSGTSEAVVLLGERFIVKAQARGMGEGAARKVLEDMDLGGLSKEGS